MYFQFAFALDRVKALASAASGLERPSNLSQAVLEGDLQGAGRVGREGTAGDHGGDPYRHDHRGIRQDRHRLARDGATSALQAALHRAGLPADARACSPICAPTASRPSSSLAAASSSCAPGPRRSTAFRPSRWSVHPVVTKFEMGRNGMPVLMQAAEGRISSTTVRASRSGSISSSAGDPSLPSAIPTAIYRCCNGRRRCGGARFGLIVHHTDAEREWAYDRQSHIGKLDKALDEATIQEAGPSSTSRADWKRVFAFE